MRALPFLALAAVLALPIPLIADDEWHAVAFMYHRFGEDRYPSTSVRLEQFEAHLEHLEQAGYQIWPLERLVTHLREGRPVPDRTVAITIDDAYLSVYREAYPRLKARGWPYTVFVSTDPVDQGLAGYMSWEQMRRMRADGAVFANHSATHDYLVRRRDGESETAWLARLRADVLRAQRRLEEELGEAPMLFAYPFGEYTTALADLVAELGFAAFGQHSGAIGRHSDPRALPRFPMAEAYADPAEFRQKAAALALPVTALSPWEPVVGGSPAPRMVAELAPSRAALDRLACFAGGQGQVPVEWMDREARRFAVQAPAPLAVGRSRYNCTAPGPERGRFYWFSQQWLVLP